MSKIELTEQQTERLRRVWLAEPTHRGALQATADELVAMGLVRPASDDPMQREWEDVKARVAALEAADKAAWEASWPEIPWDTVDESIKEDVRASTIAALTAYAEATGDKQKLYDELFAAARGLCEGEDWNSGTHAKTHGYRQKLIDAVNVIRKAGT